MEIDIIKNGKHESVELQAILNDIISDIEDITERIEGILVID